MDLLLGVEDPVPAPDALALRIEKMASPLDLDWDFDRSGAVAAEFIEDAPLSSLTSPDLDAPAVVGGALRW